MVIFGASGDLTKRLLVPALYNLACDGLLSDDFAAKFADIAAGGTVQDPTVGGVAGLDQFSAYRELNGNFPLVCESSFR